MTRFFLSNPDLEAGAIIALRGGLLYRPLFVHEKLLYTPSLLEVRHVASRPPGQREEVDEVLGPNQHRA